MSTPSNPAFLTNPPVPLRFGTSGLRGLVRDMTDLEVYINTQAFLRFLLASGQVGAGDAVAVAEDLRNLDPDSRLESSPRIGRAVSQAISDAGLRPVHCGRVPTPALAYFASRQEPTMPCVMVTGSHIPANRNGVKFYKPAGEVLKSDEAGILAAVAEVRAEQYAKTAETSAFDAEGMLREPPEVEADAGPAEELYLARYSSLFADDAPLAGQRVVVYQHSAVGRDLLVMLLEACGAETIAVERTDTFVSVDTEDVTDDDRALFARLAREHAPFAIVSTDGDSDRPLVVDEGGAFHRGDVLGVITARFVNASYAALPISCSDAVERFVEEQGIELEVERTRIGSPYVIDAMNAALTRGYDNVVGWEANGGFLTAKDVALGRGRLAALPTRDAFLPILAALISAARRKIPLSALFAELPQRATGAGLLDEFPQEASRAIIAHFCPEESGLIAAHFQAAGPALVVERTGRNAPEELPSDTPLAQDLQRCRARFSQYFDEARGFGPIETLNYLDGVRASFASGEVVHLRPSGNAPQLRIYAVSDSAARTAEIVDEAIEDGDGTLRRMAREVPHGSD